MSDVSLHELPDDDLDFGIELVGLPVEGIRELFVTLAKALRAFQLYDENNPVYHRFVSGLREAFDGLWTELGSLTLAVEESRLLAEGQEVYVNESHADSLAFLLYKDGIREITFLPGFELDEDDELERFLGLLSAARSVGPEGGEDLLTMLWDADLPHLRHRSVDILQEGVAVPEAGEGATLEELRAVFESEVATIAEAEEVDEAEIEEDEDGATVAATASPATEAPKRPAPIDLEGLDPTLYALDSREMAELFDRLEEPEFPEQREEILGILRTLLPSFLGRGALDAAATILAELRSMESAKRATTEGLRQRVGELLDEPSEPETMQELVRALEDGSIAPRPKDLGDFLVHLRPGALGPLVHASEMVEDPALRQVLREAVKGIARRNQGTLVDLVRSPDPVVSKGAALLAGGLQVSEAASAIADLLDHPDPSVRLTAIDAARGIRASSLVGSLESVLTDPDREVRIAAVKTLGELRYTPAAGSLRAAVTGRDIRAADLTEMVAFFEAYGVVGGADAVPVLQKLLQGGGVLGRGEPSEVRACAALALGKIGTKDALDALQRASNETDPVIRSAVNRALRAGRG